MPPLEWSRFEGHSKRSAHTERAILREQPVLQSLVWKPPHSPIFSLWEIIPHYDCLWLRCISNAQCYHQSWLPLCAGLGITSAICLRAHYVQLGSLLEWLIFFQICNFGQMILRDLKKRYHSISWNYYYFNLPAKPSFQVSFLITCNSVGIIILIEFELLDNLWHFRGFIPNRTAV